MSELKHVYIIQCRDWVGDMRYYVEHTDDIAMSFNNHISGTESKWTYTYIPEKIITIHYEMSYIDAVYCTMHCMKIHGINHVRGIGFRDMILTPIQLKIFNRFIDEESRTSTPVTNTTAAPYQQIVNTALKQPNKRNNTSDGIEHKNGAGIPMVNNNQATLDDILYPQNKRALPEPKYPTNKKVKYNHKT